ncbi:hypothetical protein Dtox_3078 [Desulfofarcimen acetoxidans DSM 771]|uniref:Uncharacterized protein n=1 Tax=Desulfofarcimen acetoxidans (strain ATCC 49208 / DSM 771 / KCTC 5769 / VKM B-1644 / 5575) TaxID=485916 RepID=C8W3P4_DESAS|nr:hypothetical protein [Desulfofarcimen acetoxidans]ACV63830.1 hypothetical protein Dtox_3078 [Desulfofarcimen acetoxidans DSM 771]
MEDKTISKILIHFFLQNLPESFVVILFCYSLLGIKANIKDIFLLAVIQGIFNFVIFLPISFGFHSVILTFTLIFLLYWKTKINISKIILCVLVCLLTYLLIEAISLPLMVKLTGKQYSVMFNDPILRAFLAAPVELAVLLLAIIKYKFMEKFNDWGNGYKFSKK